MRPISVPTRCAASLLLVLVLVTGACGGDRDDTSNSTSPTSDDETPSEPFPPNDVDELASVFDPMLEPMGLHLTRGALIDRSSGGYQESDEGAHLALYVEPLDDAEWTTEDYVAGLYDVTALVTPYVFDTWSGLETYDICQEPPDAEDPSEEPFPETQIEVDRAFSDDFDWEGGNIVSFLLADITDDDARIVVGRDVRDHPDYRVALDEARALAAGELDVTGTTG